MTEPPPPLPADDADADADADADEAAAADVRADPCGAPEPRRDDTDAEVRRVARAPISLAAWIAGICGALLLLCGAGVVVGTASLSQAAGQVTRRTRADAADRAVRDDAAALLEALAGRLAAHGGDFPPELPEIAPRDPWGTPVRYDRTSPRIARLRSAGPDGRFGTRDDIERRLDR